MLESIPTAQLLAEIDRRDEHTMSQTAKRVVAEVEEATGVARCDIIHGKAFKSAKYVAAHLMRDRGETWQGVANALGYKDHTSAIHAARKGAEIMERARAANTLEVS